MKLKQLCFASALARHGSFTRAAEECAITQPTLSNAIADLEEEFGEKLFLRTTRKVSLTPFGANLMPEIERVLAAQQSLLRRADALRNPHARSIRIGTSPLLSTQFLDLLIEPFRGTATDTELIFYEMNMADLYAMLEREELDFVFGVGEATKEQRGRTFLYREPLMYVPKGREQSLPHAAPAVRFDEIAGDVFVMVPDACGLTRTVRNLFRSHRRLLREYPGEALSYQVLEQWAALGIGAAMLPLSKVASTARAKRIIDKQGHHILVEFQALWSAAGAKNEPVRQFIRYLRQAAPPAADEMARQFEAAGTPA